MSGLNNAFNSSFRFLVRESNMTIYRNLVSKRNSGGQVRCLDGCQVVYKIKEQFISHLTNNFVTASIYLLTNYIHL